MAENPTQSREASDVKTRDEEASGNHHYQLDLNEHEPADIDEAFKDAVAAVDRVKVSDEDAAAASAPEEPPEPEVESAEPPAASGEADGDSAEMRQRLMRTLADFDNYRKRTEREKQALRRFANFDVFKDFLGVLDNLERAMESSGSVEDLKQGLRMIVRQHEEIQRRHGVQRVDAVGKVFDPKVHEAVAREESGEVDSPTVTQEMQRGYLLHDRLLRPAMVFVAMPAAGAGGGPGDDGEEDDGEASS